MAIYNPIFNNMLTKSISVLQIHRIIKPVNQSVSTPANRRKKMKNQRRSRSRSRKVSRNQNQVGLRVTMNACYHNAVGSFPSELVTMNAEIENENYMYICFRIYSYYIAFEMFIHAMLSNKGCAYSCA